MYFCNFLKQIVKGKNIFALLYLVLNVFVIAFIVMLTLDTDDLLFSVGFSTVIYLISIVLTLSPFGEWLLRLRHGCRRIERMEHRNRLDPIFREVESRAHRVDPFLTQEIRYFISVDATPNAFAMGRHTICITEGLLTLPDEQIMATLAHEMGHLSHKDTDLLLVVTVGNVLITAYLLFLGFFLSVVQFFCRIAAMIVSVFTRSARRSNSMNGLTIFVDVAFRFLRFILIGAFSWLWTRIGILLVMRTSRGNEYLADEFAYNTGLGRALCALLDGIASDYANTSIFESLSRSHPSKHERISRLQRFGVRYP